MKFKEFNFKLVVINELLKLKPLHAKLQSINKKYGNGKAMDLVMESEDEYYRHDPNPVLKQELLAIDIPENTAEEVKFINFWTGKIHDMYAPMWDGEDNLFDITSIEDILKLPNLEWVHIPYASLLSENLNKLDLTTLLQLKKLKKITHGKDQKWSKSHEAIFQELKSKGVKIIKD